MNRTVWTLVGFVIFLGTSLPAQDVIHLANGATLEGSVVRETETSVTIRLGDGTVDLEKTLIKKIERVAPDTVEKKARSLMTLSRFVDRETWHFLYRKGERVGYRYIKLNKDVRDGIPGYALEDRLVFLQDPGMGPEAQRTVREFVDAELRPLQVTCSNSSGTSGWELQGARKQETLEIVERWAGRVRRRTAMMRPDVALWGMQLRRMASEVVPQGGYPILTLFDPTSANFRSVKIDRRIDKVTMRGKVKDVLIFRRIVGGETLETWVDMAGKVVREEITTPYLVSLQASREEVRQYITGDGSEALGSLDLEFFSEETGLRLLRPDAAWEKDVPPHGKGRLVSFLRPSLRGTIDVFHLKGFDPGTTVAGVALDVFTRIQERCETFKPEGPFAGLVGDRNGLRFKFTSRRRNEELTTLGAILMDREQAFLILCAAPTLRYRELTPSFKEVLDSVEIVRPRDEKKVHLDPFDGMPTKTLEADNVPGN